MELQEVEKREVPEESKDECGLMPSILQGSSDSHQPYSNDKFKDLEADLGQDGACGCSHAKEEEIPTNISGSPHVISPHKLCRPKKVISVDRLHRHISVESKKKVYYGTQTAGGSGRQQSASRLLLSLGLGPRKPHRERFPLGGPRRMDVTEGRVKTEQEGSGYEGPETPES